MGNAPGVLVPTARALHFPFPACPKPVPSAAPEQNPDRNVPWPGAEPVPPRATEPTQSTWVLLCTAPTHGGYQGPHPQQGSHPSTVPHWDSPTAPQGPCPHTGSLQCPEPSPALAQSRMCTSPGMRGVGVCPQAATGIKLGKQRCPVRGGMLVPCQHL